MPDDAVGALLPAGGEVDVSQVVTLQALMSVNVGGFEHREREAWESAEEYVVGG